MSRVELEDAVLALKEAQLAVAVRIKARDELIRECRKTMRPADIARICGVSRARIAQFK